MSRQPNIQGTNSSLTEQLADLERHVRRRLGSRVRDLQVKVCDRGLVLQGHAHTYYAKQLAQQAIMEVARAPILANEIEVT